MGFKLNSNALINGILFQVLWLVAILGSAYHMTWPAGIACAALLAYQLQGKNRQASDLRLLFGACIIGLLMDSLWVNLGLYQFTTTWPFAAITPAWLLALWIGFGLTINHSIAWLSLHPILPPLMGAISGPLSYLAGIRLGAVEFLHSNYVVLACLAVSWAISLQLLVMISRSKATDTNQSTQSCETAP